MGNTLRSIVAGAMVAAAILIFSIGAVSPYLPQEISRPVWRGTLSAQSETAAPLHVRNRRGTVQIQTWDQQGIVVEGKLRVYAHGADPGAASQSYGESALHAAMEDGAFQVETLPAPPGLSLRCDLKITVPRDTNVDIENEDGTIRVGPGCGSVVARGINADMLLYAPQGPVDLDTVNGRILLLDSVQGGRAATIDGSIYARVRGGSLEAQTANGFIGVTLLAPDVTRCGLTAINGAITLALAPTCRVLLDAETERGAVLSDLQTAPTLLAGAPTQTWQGVVVGEEAFLDGNGALCHVTMRTRNGNLSIKEGG